MKKWIGIIFLVGTVLTGCGTSEGGGGAEKPVQVGEEDYKKLLSANNQLGLEMFSEVERDEKGNVFISPPSLSIALSMLYNGADGETKKGNCSCASSQWLGSKGIKRSECITHK